MFIFLCSTPNLQFMLTVVHLFVYNCIYKILVCLSLFLDIGIPYLADRSITLRRCVMYIHDSDMTLTFDLKVNLYRVFDMFFVFGPQLFLSFDIVIPYLAHKCITMGRCVTYIYNFYMTLTFGPNFHLEFVSGQNGLWPLI